MYERSNVDFYRELAVYELVRRLYRKVRVVVRNTGEVPASDVRVEICIPDGEPVAFLDSSDVPKVPKRRKNLLYDRTSLPKIRPGFSHHGAVDIAENNDGKKVEIDCGNLQPGRRMWSECFYIGIAHSGNVKLTGRQLAGNLPSPHKFTLSITASVPETKMTVDDLLSLGDSAEYEN